MAFYKRHLPHWQPKGAEFFITFRLAGSLPVEVVDSLRYYAKSVQGADNTDLKINMQRKAFQKYEHLLDKSDIGPTWLKQGNVAGIVKDALHFYDKKAYNLYAYCVMPNHVHLVFKLLTFNKNGRGAQNNYPVARILHSIKSYSALKCNRLLGRKGAFWQSESYDRVIRNQEELEKTIRYTLNNPVKAGLSGNWQAWPHTYCKPKFTATFKPR